MSERTPYADYEVIFGPTLGEQIYYDSAQADPGTTLRVYFRVTRIPSTKRITVRALQGATEADLAELRERVATGSIRRSFRCWDDAGFSYRRRREDGTWIFIVRGGEHVDDPLVQLELEMMIDLESAAPRGVTS